MLTILESTSALDYTQACRKAAHKTALDMDLAFFLLLPTALPNCQPQVVSVDCNPAQTALLELKAVAIQELDFENTWQMFGEGVHPHMNEIYERKLAPYLSQTSTNFWSCRLWYFKQGLYYQGGMASAGWGCLCLFLGLILGLMGRFEFDKPPT